MLLDIIITYHIYYNPLRINVFWGMENSPAGIRAIRPDRNDPVSGDSLRKLPILGLLCKAKRQ